jgi:hypothetical protein
LNSTHYYATLWLHNRASNKVPKTVDGDSNWKKLALHLGNTIKHIQSLLGLFQNVHFASQKMTTTDGTTLCCSRCAEILHINHTVIVVIVVIVLAAVVAVIVEIVITG